MRWPSRPTRRRSAPRSVARSQPSTVPAPRASGSSPAHTRSSVVLPAPFGPAQEDDLAELDLQADPGKGGERAEHHDGVVQLDDAVPRSIHRRATLPARRRRRARGPPAGSGGDRFGTVTARVLVEVGSPAATPRLALGRRRDRQGAHRRRVADVRVRRLPAVGDGPRVRPGAGPARRRAQPDDGDHRRGAAVEPRGHLCADRPVVDDAGAHVRPRPRSPPRTAPATTSSTTTSTSRPRRRPWPRRRPSPRSTRRRSTSATATCSAR